jgi:hypothetical protein
MDTRVKPAYDGVSGTVPALRSGMKDAAPHPGHENDESPPSRRAFFVIASEAKQSRAPGSDWIAWSQVLLAMTAIYSSTNLTVSPTLAREVR